MNGLEVFIPITFFLTIGGVIIARGPIGHALADRLRGGSLPRGDTERQLDALRAEVDELRHALAETQERVDFTERLLAKVDEPARVPPGR